MTVGYIKLHRCIDNWIFRKNPITFSVWVRLLTMANYETKQWNGMIISRGQCVTSIKHLAENCGISVQNVRTALANLQTNKQITIKPTNKFSIITICNYDSYQGTESNDQQTNQQETNKQTNNNIRSKEEKIKEVIINNKDVFSNETKKEPLSYSSFIEKIKDLCPTISEFMKLPSIKQYIALSNKYTDTQLLCVIWDIDNVKSWHSYKHLYQAIIRYLASNEIPNYEAEIP